VFFAQDEAGLYLQATTSFAWSVMGETPIVRADPGRKQTHFYGALNLLTGQEIVLRSDVVNNRPECTRDIHPKCTICLHPYCTTLPG